MRHPELWKPTKFTLLNAATAHASSPAQQALQAAAPRHARIRMSQDPAALGPGSTLIATLAARWYAAALAQHARGVLLELGCGAMPYRALYRHLTTDVWATDWPQSLHTHSHADLYCDLNAGIPLACGMADTVLAADVLEHIYRPQALLAEAWRVLRPGGVMLLNTPFMYWVHEAPHDYFRYTQHALQRMACDAGFQPLQVDPLGGALCVLADIGGKLLQGHGRAGAALARGLQRAVLRAASRGPGRLPQSASSPLLMAAVLRKPLPAAPARQAAPA